MNINKKRSGNGWKLWFIPLFAIGLFLAIRLFIHDKNIALFNPKGIIAQQQHSLMVFTLTVFFIVAVPSLFLFYFIAWRYRESNAKAKHNPQQKGGKALVFIMWGIPTIVMLVLVSVMAPATYRLAPQKVIESSAKPLTIQVITLRWKWLFIYPEQQVASLNYVYLPVNTPVTFHMTADETPMSSFWIPNLGGQLYTMTGHSNRLNLRADIPGIYTGSSAEINGIGFADMKFTAKADGMDKFNEWVREVKQSSKTLDNATYNELLKPSQVSPANFYSGFDPKLFASVIAKYEAHGGQHH